MPTDAGNGTFEEAIDDKVYTFTVWGAEKGLLALTELNAIAGDAMAIAGKMLTAGKGDMATQQEALECLIKAITHGLGVDRELTVKFIKRLTSDGVLCDKRQFVWDLQFRGQMLHMMKVLRAGLQVQFADFFSALAGKFTAARAQATPSPES